MADTTKEMLTNVGTAIGAILASLGIGITSYKQGVKERRTSQKEIAERQAVQGVLLADIKADLTELKTALPDLYKKVNKSAEDVAAIKGFLKGRDRNAVLHETDSI